MRHHKSDVRISIVKESAEAAAFSFYCKT